METEILAIAFLAALTYCLIAGPAVVTRAAFANSLEERPKLLEVRLDRVVQRVHESMGKDSMIANRYLEKFNDQELTFTPQFAEPGK